MFEEFKGISKEEWIKMLNKELRDGNINQLDWMIDDHIIINPVIHPTDQAKPATIFGKSAAQNIWSAATKVIVNDFVQTNEILLSALKFGANTLVLDFTNAHSVIQWESLFRGIELGFIKLIFCAKSAALTKLISEFDGFLDSKSIAIDQIDLSIDLDKSPDPDFYFSVKKVFPSIRFVIKSEQKESILQKIATLTRHIHALAEEPGLTHDQIHEIFNSVIIHHFVGDNFYLNLASIRAIQNNFLLLQKSWGISNPHGANIYVEIDRANFIESEHDNIIKAGAQVFSALSAGVSILSIPAFGSDMAFDQRMALNIHNIMHLESYMDRVIDPWAGSYFIESLTHEIAASAWQQFIDEKEKE